MKGNILVIAIVTTGLISSCNMGKNKNNDGVVSGTDSSMMSNNPSAPSPLTTKTDTNNTANKQKIDNVDAGGTSIMPPADVDTTNSKVNAKPNIAKKGKKGSVNIDINTTSGKKEMTPDKEGYYGSAEVLPSFPGGQRAMENFFEKNIQYPAEAVDNGIEGKVNIVFLVDENGKVSSPKLVSQHIGYGIETEAMRVFRKMPNWTAGKIKGKNVKTRYTLPVNFRLD